MKKSNRDKDAIEDNEEEELEVSENTFNENSDLCQRLMERYGNSSAPQHRHLCASAVAMRTILQDEGLPLTPSAYFASAITAINDASETLDSNAIAALSSFLSILLPLVPHQSLPPSKANDAVLVLIKLLQRSTEALSAATVRSLLKSLDVLMRFCDLEDWSAVKLPLEIILTFSIDKRPKVRRCAQVCGEKVFKSFQCSIVIKEASKLVLSLFKTHMPLAIELSASSIIDGSRSEMLSSPEHLEVLHMLNALKLFVPYLSDKASLKLLSELHKLMTCQFSPLTRNILNLIEALFESSRAKVIVPKAENIMISLVSYVSSGEKNPIDTVMSAAILLKCGLDKLHVTEPSIWIRNLPLVFCSLAGLLTSEASTASKAGGILKELINHHMDKRTFPTSENQLYENEIDGSTELSAIKSTCAVLENILSTCGGVPNEHILAVTSDLFLKLGDISYFFMKGIVLKLADLAVLANRDISGTKHLQECIGSAVISMGPEKILTLIPVSLHAENFTCSNIWLVPILKEYVVGASLKYFMENIVPLAESVQLACRKVKKARFRKDMKTYAHGLWGLIPAFCRYPTDTYQNFEPLAKLFIVMLKDSFMHENIATALKELVNQNRRILKSNQDASEFAKQSTAYAVKDSFMESVSVPSHYSKKIATKNIKALASYSMDLLQSLTVIFFDSPPQKRAYLKDTIGCLASITEASKVKKFFISSLEKFQLINRVGEFEKSESKSSTSVDKEQGNSTEKEKEDAQRCMVMEFASSLVDGANEDLIDLIFDYIKPALQAIDGVGQSEACYALSRILEEHTWFYSSRFDELMDLLLCLNSLVDINSLRSRFVCFHILLIHIIKSDLEEMNAKAFLILNEIILTLKDSKEEPRKAAYDILLIINSSLKNSTRVSSEGSHQRLLTMIMGYLSGASPHVMSGAVAALSLLIYKDTDVCFSVPNLIPSVLVLLQNKGVEVIKAALGFIKVLVSCLQAKDLQNLLPDIVNGILPWSPVSRHHFREKVTVILEIMIRKCGSASVESVVPEKYRGFLKSVLEHRHSNTSSKEAGTTDMEPKLADAIPKRWQKRTHGELSIPSEENGSREPTTTQRKKEKKHNANYPSTNESRRSTGSVSTGEWVNKTEHSHLGKLMKGQSRDNAKNNKRRDFDRRRPTSGEKGKMWHKKVSEINVQRPASSKFHKHKKVGRQHKRTNK